MNHDDDIQRVTTMVDEQDLHELFARHRPDADAFGRGVQQRLAEPGTGDGHGGPSPLLRAAGRLPVDLSWLGAAKWTFLAPPTILLTLAGAAFLGSLHWLRHTLARGTTNAQTTPDRQSTRAELMCGVFLVVLLLVLALPWIGHRWLSDTLLLALVASMLLLVAAVRRQAVRGSFDRATVAGIATGVLESLLVFGVFWFHAESPFGGTAQWQTATFLLLVTGLLALLPLAPRAAPGALLTIGIVAWFGMRDLGVRRPDLDTLADFVASAPAPEAPFVQVRDLATLVLEQRESGRPTTLPAAVAAALTTARDAEPAAAFALTAEHRMGRVDQAEWQRLARRGDHAARLDRLLSEDRALRPYPFSEYEVAMLVATRDLDDGARDRLAMRLLAGLEEAPFPLQATVVAARWLDQIGRGAVLAARSTTIQDLLARHQHLGSHDPGGFAASLDNPHSNREATQDAIELMARFGVPATLDLPSLHRHLRRASRLFPTQSVAQHTFPLTAYVDQRRLERLVGVPQRSFLRTLQDERTLVAMAALVALCLYAAWATPRRTGLPIGAMP